MRKITAAQNRKIHMLASQLGMDDDLLHEFVGMVAKKEHISSLMLFGELSAPRFFTLNAPVFRMVWINIQNS